MRGVKKIALLVIDEAQHLSDSAMASMLPTQNRAWNPQTIYMGTPPGPRDNGEAFTRLRDKARAGRTHSTLYVEFTADRDADPLDRQQWRKANPSYPAHTSDESIANLWENLTGDDFRREALGIWDEHALSQAIDRRQWEEATIERRRPGGVMSFGIDMNPQRTRLTIGACMRYDDNTAHIELAEYRDTNQDGTMWAVNLIDKVWEQTASLVIDGQSPATALLPDLAQAGVTVTVTAAIKDGERFQRGQILATVKGPVRDLLTAERIALNFTQRMSGIATMTAAFVDAVNAIYGDDYDGPVTRPCRYERTRIVDTRKTTPGLRPFEKYAVVCGGGHNHRYGLSDAVMMKDNHLAALAARGIDLAGAIRHVREQVGHTTHIEVEVDRLDQIPAVLAGGADTIMLDNFSLDDTRRGVELIDGKAIVEASGNMSLERVPAVAVTGVDVISVGALTHSVRSIDLGLDWN